jgi:hypothetical protein
MVSKKCEPCSGTGSLPNGKVCYKCDGKGIYGARFMAKYVGKESASLDKACFERFGLSHAI